VFCVLQLAAFPCFGSVRAAGTTSTLHSEGTRTAGYRNGDRVAETASVSGRCRLRAACVSIYAGTNGLADDVPGRKIQQFEKELLRSCTTNTRRYSATMDRETGIVRRERPWSGLKKAVERIQAIYKGVPK